MMGRRWRAVGWTVLVVGLGACQGAGDDTPPPPTAEEAERHFEIGGEWSLEMRGNVAELRVYQSRRNLERGGELWAKVGPYVYLFSPGTRDLFSEEPGLAAVRVVTLAPDGEEVARATLTRGTLNSLTWRRALNVAGLARRDGTQRPTRLEDLVEWGEDHTDYRYSPRYVEPT